MNNNSHAPFQPIPPASIDPNKVELENPTGVTPVYANNAAVLVLPHDFRLVLSEVVSDGPANAPRIELRASVGMAPTMAKALHAALGQTLNMYEQQTGEIKWPPQQPKTV